MATILSFVPRKVYGTTSRNVSGEATIIFFTGVRYEAGAARGSGNRLPGSEAGPIQPGAATGRNSARTPR
ncbi:MAG: hypothetical protein Q8Q62_05925 [Mesorhizobium sp.]|nr:hypothetical protein [Mesorhizobium sp.]